MKPKKHDPAKKQCRKRYSKPKLRKHGTLPPVAHAQTYY